MKLKKLSAGFSAAVLGFSSLLTIAITPMVSAAADTCTWTGAGDGTTFADGANWTGCDNAGVPETVDTLVFGSLAGSPSVTLTNNLGYEVAGVNVTASSSATNYDINTLSLAAGATINDQGDAGANYTNVSAGTVTALGALTITGGDGRFSGLVWSIGGVLTLGDGVRFYGDNVSSNGVVVENGATLIFTATSGAENTGTYPITLGGGAGTSNPVVEFGGYYNSGFQNVTYTFANPLTLLHNASVLLGNGKVTVNQTGSIDGVGFAISLASNSASGSTLVLAPSSNNSGTVAGTYTGSGAGVTGGSGATPTSPETGFALASSNPALTFGVVTLAALAIAFAGRRLQVASAKASRR
jgi:hypothetical protein